MTNKLIAAAVSAALISAPLPGLAAPSEIIQPVQIAAEQLRYNQGDFIVEANGRTASVQVSPLPSDHGNLSFSVAILNASNRSITVDATNIRVEGAAEPVRVLTKAEMTSKAKSRSIWSAVLVGMVGGIAAGISASQRTNYNVTTRTPRGTYRTRFNAPCTSCQVNAAMISAGTGAALSRIHGQLDATRQALGNEMLQLTTIDPGDSYAGRIYLTRFKRASLSQMRLIVNVNGEDFAFGFRFAPRGAPMPQFKVIDAPALSTMPVVAPQPAIAIAPSVRPLPVLTTIARTQPVLTPFAAVAHTPVQSAPRPAINTGMTMLTPLPAAMTVSQPLTGAQSYRR